VLNDAVHRSFCLDDNLAFSEITKVCSTRVGFLVKKIASQCSGISLFVNLTSDTNSYRVPGVNNISPFGI
jgi:hypothetical protein